MMRTSIPAFCAPIRIYQPLVHAITNYVTVNDVVNIILASGAKAICADAPEESAQITSLAKSLLINIGTPSRQRLSAMLESGRKANQTGIPVVLDPVGAGASDFRSQILQELLSEIHFSCIRGNASEIAAISGISFSSEGVEDAGAAVSDAALQDLARKYDTVIALTGERDRVTDGSRILSFTHGTALQKQITGSGCMLSGLLASAFGAMRCAMNEPNQDRASDLAAADNSSDHPIVPESTTSVLDMVADTMKGYELAAEKAERDMQASGHIGTAAFRNFLIDTISVNGLPDTNLPPGKMIPV